MGFLNYGDEKEVFGKIHEMTLAAADSVKKLRLAVQQFHTGKFQGMEQLMLDTSSAESHADHIKADIRRLVAESSFLPHFRQDVLELTKRIELIADTAETNSKLFYITESMMKKSHAKIPKKVLDAILRLTDYGVELSEKTAQAIACLPKDIEQVRPIVSEIGKKQDDGNDLEMAAIKAVVDSNLDGFMKTELIDMVSMSGNLADRCNESVHILTYMLFTSHS